MAGEHFKKGPFNFDLEEPEQPGELMVDDPFFEPPAQMKTSETIEARLEGPVRPSHIVRILDYFYRKTIPAFTIAAGTRTERTREMRPRGKLNWS